MRNFILVSCFLFLTASFAMSQSAFQKKDLFINAGMSLIDYRDVQYNGAERMGRSLPVFLSAEYGVNRLISIGPFAGYYFRKYNYSGLLETPNDDYQFKSHFATVAIKTSFHFSTLLEDKWNIELLSNDLDLYGSVYLGYEINRLSKKNDFYLNYPPKLVIGASVGARYFLNQRMALFAEFGPGMLGLAAIGVTARF